MGPAFPAKNTARFLSHPGAELGEMNQRTLYQLSAAQHALVTRAQLTRAGITRGEIDHYLAAERLIRMYAGVFRLAGAPITSHQRILAACLSTNGPASHRAATSVWGADLGPTPPLEVMVRRGRCPSPLGVIVHRSSTLTSRDITRRHGIPVTNPLRTLVDLGAVAGAAQVATFLESLTSRRIITIAGAKAYRERFSGRGNRGVGVLGYVLDHRALKDQPADGMLEPVMAELCRRRGLPMPAFQVWVLVHGQWRRMDFAYETEMINIEVDGYEHHGGRYDNWVDDAHRDNELTALGWLVLRFTWHDVRDRPAYVGRIITKVLAERRRLLRAA